MSQEVLAKVIAKVFCIIMALLGLLLALKPHIGNDFLIKFQKLHGWKDVNEQKMRIFGIAFFLFCLFMFFIAR